MGLFMGIFLDGYFRPFIFFRVPIVFALAPPMGSGTMWAGPWPGPHGHISGISTAFNPGAAPPVLRAGRAWCVIIRAVPSLVRPARVGRRRNRSPATGPGLGARCGVGTAACYPHCWYALFKEQRRGRYFPLSLSSRKRGWVNTLTPQIFQNVFSKAENIVFFITMLAYFEKYGMIKDKSSTLQCENVT